eukprot:5918839-Amphidinium_carterae.1
MQRGHPSVGPGPTLETATGTCIRVFWLIPSVQDDPWIVAKDCVEQPSKPPQGGDFQHLF